MDITSATLPRWFVGMVHSADAGTYNLNIAPTDKDTTSLQLIGGLATSTCMAHLFGMKDCTLIQPGCKVLCYQVTPVFCYVIQVLPSYGDIDVADFPSRSLIGAGDAIVDSANIQGYGEMLNKSFSANTQRPSDIVDGEHVISNPYGIALQLLFGSAILKSSDLAQIQCHMLDDLVKIISHNFKHYTALGEFNVFHDGQGLHAEFGAAASPTEGQGVAEGAASLDTSLMTQADPPDASSASAAYDDSSDFITLKPENAVAIERFKIYLGKLGDFFNMFLTKPAEGQIRSLDGTVPTKFDTGLFQQRISMDGGYYLRSTNEVLLEKVNWIRVPTRVYAPEDPNGDDGTEIVYPPKEEYEFDNTFQYQDNPFLAYLQLRNYVAFVNEKVAYQNFIAQAKDFAIANSLDTADQINKINAIDPNTPNSLLEYQLRCSGIYLMKNGGITFKDAWGSAIVMEGGNIYMQPAKDLVMQPMRNFVAKVGQFASFAAKKDIDFSSTEKGIRFKSDKAMYLYSANSGIVLQSDGTTPTAGTPDPASNAIQYVDGVVLKSKGGIHNLASGSVNVLSKGMVVKTTQDVRIDSGRTTQISSDGDVVVAGTTNTAIISKSSLFMLADGSWLGAGAQSTEIGQKDQSLGITFPKNSIGVNILGLLPTTQFISDFDKEILKDDNLLDLAYPFTTQALANKLTFKFLNTTDYGLSADIVRSQDPIPMTMAQQEDQLSGMYNLKPWQEAAVGGSYPYPGTDAFSQAYASTTGPIPNLQKFDGNDFTGSPTASSAKMPVTSGTLNNYKILEP